MVNLSVLTSPEEFFSEWTDEKKVFAFFAVTTMFLLLSTIWVSVNFPELKPISDVFTTLLVIGVIFGGIDFLTEKNILFGFVFFGESFLTAITAIVIGVVVALFLVGINFAVISSPLASVPLVFPFASFVFIVLIAPYAEEKFFRMTLYPTALNIFSAVFNSKLVGGLFSLLFVSGIFAFFHFAVYAADLNLMLAAFFFSIIAIVGNRIFESVGFSVALHYTVNFIAFGGFPAGLFG